MSNMRLTKNFKDVKSMLSSGKASSLREIGEEVSSNARDRAPVDTGELRDSIGYNVNDESVDIGAGAKHAPPVELGSSKQKAQPYLKPAAYDSVSKMADIVKKNMSN